MSKGYGYSVSEVMGLMLLLPLMLLPSVHAFYRNSFQSLTEMKKDVIYRLKNNDKMPWRRLLYGIEKKFQELVNYEKEIASNSAFIVDDTADFRTGQTIENISIIHDYSTGKKRLI